MTTHKTSVRPAPPKWRGRAAVTAIAVASVAVFLYFVPAYLVPGEVPDRIAIREDVPVHLPLLIVHAAAAGIALLIGPFQFFGSIRRRWPQVHRAIGRVYLIVGVGVGGLTGLVVAVLTLSGPINLVAFTALDLFWLYSAWQAYQAVRARDFATHERWMLRNMAATFAAVTLRVYLGLFIAVQMPMLESVYGGDFEALFATAYTAATVSSFVLNLLFIEIYLRRKDSRRNRAGAV